MAPEATVLTTSSFVSTPTTCIPRLAINAAVGNPMYPRPTTVTFFNSGIEKNLDYPLAGVAVAERVMGACHRRVSFVVVKQAKGLPHDLLVVRTDEARRTGLDPLR